MKDCILWSGCPVGSMGYGTQTINGKKYRAHRLAWEKVNGPIPTGMCVLHRCDVPRCINVNHLFLGTYRDNWADAFAKGRTLVGRRRDMSQENPFARWFAQQSYHVTQQELANELRVDRTYVNKQLRAMNDIMPSLEVALAIEKLTGGVVTVKQIHDFVIANREKLKEAA